MTNIIERLWATEALLEETEANMRSAEERGYRLALRHIKEFGADLPPEKALSDEERYILDQCAEVLEARWVSEAPKEKP